MQRFWHFLMLGGMIAAAVLGFFMWGTIAERQRSTFLKSLNPAATPQTRAEAAVVSDKTEQRITAFCGDCHAVPRPQNFPRNLWHEKVGVGYEYYARSGRNDLDPPPRKDVVAYYRALAPEQFVFAPPEAAEKELQATFETEKLDWNESTYVLPAVAGLRWLEAPWSNEPELFACDIRDGSVSAIDIRAKPVRRRVIARLQNPCHIEPGDVDGDGAVDLIVADLGSMHPDDHDRGRVVLLRFDPRADSFSTTVIAKELGRVSDARPADFDRDGDLDVVVAEFGHYRTGSLLLLENTSEPGGELRFETKVLDRRPGTIHVPVHDFNQDGRADIAALVSQEYERVDLFIHQQEMEFRLHSIWAAPDLTFGSSGLEVVDMDADGDLDLLVTNGDTFDNAVANPSHGVSWLENLGQMQFAYHRLADVPGAYRALPADIDLDGDLDLLVVTFLSAQVIPASLQGPSTASVVCLEQTESGQFAWHVLEAGVPRHPSLEVGDFDGDGDFDFAVGSYVFPPVSTAIPPRLTIWWNQLKR